MLLSWNGYLHQTLLNLAFPTFVFCLVGLVIVVSSYSFRFSKFIGNKDPVAILATFILLSYAKFLEIYFESLSAGILKYPDGSSKHCGSAMQLSSKAHSYLHCSCCYFSDGFDLHCSSLLVAASGVFIFQGGKLSKHVWRS